MSCIPLTTNRSSVADGTHAPVHAYPVDDTDYVVQHRRDTEMADFMIEIVCEYSTGTVYGETDDRCEANFIQDIRRYADRYRDNRYQFIKNQRFLQDLHDSHECKRETVLHCNLFFNGFIVFDDVVEFVNGWGAVDETEKQMDCEKCDLEMTKIA